MKDLIDLVQQRTQVSVVTVVITAALVWVILEILDGTLGVAWDAYRRRELRHLHPEGAAYRDAVRDLRRALVALDRHSQHPETDHLLDVEEALARVDRSVEALSAHKRYRSTRSYRRQSRKAVAA